MRTTAPLRETYPPGQTGVATEAQGTRVRARAPLQVRRKVYPRSATLMLLPPSHRCEKHNRRRRGGIYITAGAAVAAAAALSPPTQSRCAAVPRHAVHHRSSPSRPRHHNFPYDRRPSTDKIGVGESCYGVDRVRCPLSALSNRTCEIHV